MAEMKSLEMKYTAEELILTLHEMEPPANFRSRVLLLATSAIALHRLVANAHVPVSENVLYKKMKTLEMANAQLRQRLAEMERELSEADQRYRKRMRRIREMGSQYQDKSEPVSWVCKAWSTHRASIFSWCAPSKSAPLIIAGILVFACRRSALLKSSTALT